MLENGAIVVATDLAGEKLDAFAQDLDSLAPANRPASRWTSPVPKPSARPSTRSTPSLADSTSSSTTRASPTSRRSSTWTSPASSLEKVNVDGTLVVLKETGKRMIDKGVGGDIVVMSTKNVPWPEHRLQGQHHATKAACHKPAASRASSSLRTTSAST